jgi:hypothetical protein
VRAGPLLQVLPVVDLSLIPRFCGLVDRHKPRVSWHDFDRVRLDHARAQARARRPVDHDWNARALPAILDHHVQRWVTRWSISSAMVMTP